MKEEYNSNKNIKLRYWIGLGYCLPIALSIITAGIVATNVETVREKEQELLRAIKVEQQIGDLGFNVQTMSRTTRGYLLEKNALSKETYQTSKVNADKAFEELELLIRDEQQKENLAKLKEELKQLDNINSELIAIVDEGRIEDARQAWKDKDGREQIVKIVDLLTDFKERQKDIVDENSTEQQAAINSLFNSVIGGALLSSLIALLFGLWLVSNIAGKMNRTASDLAASTTEIAATVEQQERTASQQAASVNETTTTMNELGASSRQSAQQAEAASTAAQMALSMAQQGNQAVEETLEEMSDLKNKVGAIAEQIVHLSEQTNQIGNISQLVSDIANQTNMLALNAAVEAVRAGEHGKGFAVVASEIRKLADQSKKSAEKINNLVGEIQNSINSTVMVTDEGSKTVNTGMEVSQKTAQAFAGVTDAVNNVVINNQQISLNIKQQAIAIEQVLQAMNTINQGARETASGITQTRVGTEKLNEATEDLKTLV